MAKGDYDPRKNALVTFPDLLWMVHKWLIDVYARDGHEGRRRVPSKLWDDLTLRYPVEPLSSVHELDCIFGRSETATLTRQGVRFKYIHYISDELVDLLREPAFLKSLPGPRQITFRYDAGDLSEIKVYLPHVDRYLTVPCGAYWRDDVAGVSVWEHQAAIDYANHVLKIEVDRDALARARTALFQYNGLSYGPRSEGIGRYALAGDSTETGPKRPRRSPATQSDEQAPTNVVAIDASRARRRRRSVSPAPASPSRTIRGVIKMED